MFELPQKARQKIILQIWTLPIIILIIITALLIYAYNWSVDSLASAKNNSTQLQNQQKEIVERLNKISLEEQEIIEKSKIYQGLAQGKITMRPNQLDIQELLFKMAKLNSIGEFQYSFSDSGYSQVPLKTAVGIAEDENVRRSGIQNPQELKISVLAQTIKFETFHELQFFNFLNSWSVNLQNYLNPPANKLADIPKSLARINKCDIQRSSPEGNLSTTKSNFKVECKVEWINILAAR